MSIPAIELPTRRRTIQLAQRLGRHLQAGDLLVLAGALGAGKTFFARALCRALGVPHDVPVTSPTFTLVHEYEGRLPIAHADLYRLREPGELVELGLPERRADGAVVVVEWGEPYLEALGGDGLVIELGISGRKEGRTALLTATGPRSRALADACAA